ncbi:MAG: response regulator transcription factor [Anaerolineales bacterium]|nr:response regulator transcription factor [Anaerolineales bacterium]
MTAIRVLVVDDHTLFRDGLSAIFMNVPDIKVVGEAGTGPEAVSQAKSLLPDVVLMDINMPDLNGIEATQQVLAERPDTRIIMLTMLEDDDSLFAAMCAGARGYILKGADKAEVLKTIRAVAQGEALFGPAIATRLTSFFQNSKGVAHQNEVASPFPDLTEREREVLELIAAGENNQEIAQYLHISAKTVSNHISNIFNKLQVADRAQAIVKARQAGLGN